MGAWEPKKEVIGGSRYPKFSAGLRPGRQILRAAYGRGGIILGPACGQGRQGFLVRPPYLEAALTATSEPGEHSSKPRYICIGPKRYPVRNG